MTKAAVTGLFESFIVSENCVDGWGLYTNGC